MRDPIPPSVSIDGRLPHPAIITCNQPLPLRILIARLNDSSATIFLKLIELVLVSNTITRAHQLERTDAGSFVLMSRSNLRQVLQTVDGKSQSKKDMEIDSSMWNHLPLPNTIAPTFETCNLSRSYFLDIKVGLSWGMENHINVSLGICLQYFFVKMQFVKATDICTAGTYCSDYSHACPGLFRDCTPTSSS